MKMASDIKALSKETEEWITPELENIFSEEEIMSMLTGAEVTLTAVQAKVKVPAEEMIITSEDVRLVIR